PPETVALFTRRVSTPPNTSRTPGWASPSAPSQSRKHFSANSFGHLGYTGTSLWIDPTRQLSVTLLTNRTWPDCTNQAIKQVRPRFHDAIIDALDQMLKKDALLKDKKEKKVKKEKNLQNLRRLRTEQSHPDATDLDRKSALEIATLINAE